MATAWITEFADISAGSGSKIDVQVAATPALTVQKITYTTSTASAAFGSNTKLVRILVSNGGARSFIAFGAAPTATTDTSPIEDSVAEYFGVTPGQKVAIYNGTA